MATQKLFLKTKVVLQGTFIASNHFLKIHASALLPVQFYLTACILQKLLADSLANLLACSLQFCHMIYLSADSTLFLQSQKQASHFPSLHKTCICLPVLSNYPLLLYLSELLSRVIRSCHSISPFFPFVFDTIAPFLLSKSIPLMVNSSLQPSLYKEAQF